MARYTGPREKIERRLGEKLFLKGERSHSQKSAMVKKPYPPGIHGRSRPGKLSEYGQQLKFESGDTIKAFKIIELQGKFPGPYGDYWYYRATDGAREWTVAIFTNYYNPDTGTGAVCSRGNCAKLPGKTVDIIFLWGFDDEYSIKEFYDPIGELHEGRPYISTSGIIVHK